MFNKNSIAYKYLKASIFIVIIPVFVANIVLNKLYSNTLMESYSDRILQNIRQVSYEIGSEIKAYTLQASAVAGDRDIIGLVDSWTKDGNYEHKSAISKQVESKLSYLKGIDTIVFLYKNEGMYCYKNKSGISEKEIRQSCLKYVRDSKEGHVMVMDSLAGITDASKGKFMRSLVALPFVTGSENNIEAVYFAFRSDVLDSISSFKVFGNSGRIFISDSGGNILISQNRDMTVKAREDINLLAKSGKNTGRSYTSTVDGEKTFVTSYTVPDSGWKIIGLVDYGDLTRDMHSILDFALVLLVFMVALFLVFSFLFFRDILNPIDKLTKKMKIVEKGYFDTAIEIKGNDEINNLGKSFNKMVSEIRKLINERDIKEKEKEKAEIEALQSQINPHFISNTLNSIRLMSMIAKADSIKNMTEAFMKLLTSTFGRKGVFNTIETEMDILSSYIYIMKVRFGDKFDVVFEIDENIRQFYILKLVLQPILENAILHGISDTEEKGVIRIKGCRLGENLMLEITDNGKGMTEEELNDLMSEGYRNTKGFNGMGLMNVDRRIKLNHGDKYGLRIKSVFGEFTSVKIVLPVILFEHGGMSNA